MALLGIDIGDHSCFVGAAIGGGIEIQWKPLNRGTDKREIRLIGTYFLEQIHI